MIFYNIVAYTSDWCHTLRHWPSTHNFRGRLDKQQRQYRSRLPYHRHDRIRHNTFAHPDDHRIHPIPPTEHNPRVDPHRYHWTWHHQHCRWPTSVHNYRGNVPTCRLVIGFIHPLRPISDIVHVYHIVDHSLNRRTVLCRRHGLGDTRPSIGWA